MTTLTVQVPEEEIQLFKGFLKKLNGKVISVDKVPNKETIKAMNELKKGKGKIYGSAKELFATIK